MWVRQRDRQSVIRTQRSLTLDRITVLMMDWPKLHPGQTVHLPARTIITEDLFPQDSAVSVRLCFNQNEGDVNVNNVLTKALE